MTLYTKNSLSLKYNRAISGIEDRAISGGGEDEAIGGGADGTIVGCEYGAICGIKDRAISGGGEDEAIGGGADGTIVGCEYGAICGIKDRAISGGGEEGGVGGSLDGAIGGVEYGAVVVVNEIIIQLDDENELVPFNDRLSDGDVMEWHIQECGMVRAKDKEEMTRLVVSKLISDKLLSKYSYIGQRTKKEFSEFANITYLIVQSVVRNEISQIKGKDEKEIQKIKKQLEIEVQLYFQQKCFKYAHNRFNKA